MALRNRISPGHGVMRPRREATFVVNTEATESDPTALDRDTLKRLAVGGGAKTAAAPRRRVELWHTLGAILLVLLLGEALLLRRK